MLEVIDRVDCDSCGCFNLLIREGQSVCRGLIIKHDISQDKCI